MSSSKSYSELKKLKTFEERFEYLKLSGAIGEETYGYDRYLNQALYKSKEWKDTRNKVIIRDNGCDLGVNGFEINTSILIHHINPISKEDIINRDPKIFDLNNLISCTQKTHNALHYGSDTKIKRGPTVRRPNDTCPWKG